MTAIDIPAPHRSAGAPTAAFTVEDVFERMGATLLGYLRAAGARDPEDVLGEVLVRVTRHLGRFRGGDADLRRWVFTIAHNCVMDEHRRVARDRRLLRRIPPPAPAPPPSDPFDPVLAEAIGRLTPDQREVVTLRFVADLPVDEVAGITRRRAGAVKSLQHRALRKLAETLEGGTVAAEVAHPSPAGRAAEDQAQAEPMRRW